MRSASLLYLWNSAGESAGRGLSLFDISSGLGLAVEEDAMVEKYA